MDQGIMDKLYEDFEIAIKPGQGFKYVRTRDILDRLNKTFSGNWGVQVKYHNMFEDEVLVLVSVHLYDDEGNVKATQEGFGSAKKFRNTELGNVYKSATSKAVKSAVRNWGVALFLDEDNEVNTQGVETGRTGASMPNMSNGSQSMPSPPANAGTVSPPSGPNVGMPSNIATTMPGSASQSTPSFPNAMPDVQAVQSTVAPEALGQPVPTNTPAPPSNTPPSGGLPTMNAVPGAPPESAPVANDTHNITAVQKVAIESRLGAKGLTFDQISEEFYANRESTAPESIDGMLYTDALDMVAFLNTK